MIKFFVTGTQAYGPVSNNSDIDIVLQQKELGQLEDFLEHHQIKTFQTPEQEEYDNLTGVGGFYFELGPLMINIIGCRDDSDFKWWYQRTQYMRSIDPIENRDDRLDEFRIGTL